MYVCVQVHITFEKGYKEIVQVLKESNYPACTAIYVLLILYDGKNYNVTN